MATKGNMNEAPTPRAPVPVAAPAPQPSPVPVTMVTMVECRTCRATHRRDEACPSCRRRLLEG